MKVRFSIRGKLYVMCDFEIEYKSKEDVEEALDEIGDCVSVDDLDMKLRERFGTENVELVMDVLIHGSDIKPSVDWRGYSE